MYRKIELPGGEGAFLLFQQDSDGDVKVLGFLGSATDGVDDHMDYLTAGRSPKAIEALGFGPEPEEVPCAGTFEVKK